MSQFQQPPIQPQEPHTGYPQWQQPPQQWYPPPPQMYEYPSQQQRTPPPVRPPRDKRRERKEITVAVSILLVVLVALGTIGVFTYASANKSTATTQIQATAIPTSLPTATPTQLPTPTPTPTVKPTPTPTPNPHGDIGVTLSTGDWIVTLNNVYTSTGDEFDTPNPGNIYIVVDVTVLNNVAGPQLLSSEGNFTFQDETGQAYNESITEIGKPPDGTIPAETKLRGQLVYEASKSLHTFTLTFQNDNGDSIVWNIKV